MFLWLCITLEYALFDIIPSTMAASVIPSLSCSSLNPSPIVISKSPNCFCLQFTPYRFYPCLLTCYEKCRQMYDYVLFSYILDYSCLPFLLPTSTLVFRYFNLEAIALTSSFGIFSDVASPAIIL